MSGFQHSVAGGNGNLVVTSLQSPNFASGAAGWQIAKDGSAQFNNAVIRGTITAGTFEGTDFIINAAGMFAYSGTPAAGNLIASVAPSAGTDEFGNAYLAGFAVYGYGTIGGTVQLASIGGQPVLEMTPGYTSHLDSPPALSATTAGNGTNAEQYITYLTTGFTTGGGAGSAVQLGLFSGSQDGTVAPYAEFALNYAGLLYILSTGILAAAQPGGTGPETWHAATPAGSWTALETLAYRRSPDGYVDLSGRLTVPSGVTSPATVTTLPAAYAPARTETFAATVNNGSTIYIVLALIDTGANIRIYGPSAALTAGYTLNIGGRYPLGA